MLNDVKLQIAAENREHDARLAALDRASQERQTVLTLASSLVECDDAEIREKARSVVLRELDAALLPTLNLRDLS